jgi:hypothetical protein
VDPRDLLQVAAEHLADADRDHPIAPADYARLITYTVDALTGDHPHHGREIPTPTTRR